MLQKLRVKGFKSLADVTVEFPQMSVLFGPDSAGKSNLLDAIQALSRIGTERTIMDALDGRMIRGYAFELFALPEGGISGLTSSSTAQFSIEAELAIPEGRNGRKGRYRYGVDIEIGYRSGALANCGEHLSALSIAGEPKGKPAIEATNGQISVRRQSGGGRPRLEQVGLNYAILSNARLASPAYKYIERARTELRDWGASTWIRVWLCVRKCRRWMSPISDRQDVDLARARPSSSSRRHHPLAAPLRRRAQRSPGEVDHGGGLVQRSPRWRWQPDRALREPWPSVRRS